MIRVNLLKDSTFAGTGTATATSFGEGTRLSPSIDGKELVIKVLLFIAPVLLALGGLQYIVSQKHADLQTLQIQVNSQADAAKKLSPEIDAVQNFKKEKEKLQVQIETIKSLSHERLRNVKSLAALQDLVPQKVWLSGLKFQDTKVEITGQSVDDKMIADFMTALEESIYFMNVRLIRSAEATNKEGSIKSFEIETTMKGM